MRLIPSTASSGEIPNVWAKSWIVLFRAFSPRVGHLRQSHRLQAVLAAHARGELSQDHVAKGLVDRHPPVVSERRRRFFPGQFGQECVDQALLLAEKLHEPVGDRIERKLLVALHDDLVHHVPQADTPGVILHPARLKSGVLAAVGKADQLLVAVRGGIYHRLGQDVDIGHRHRSHLAGRLDLPPADAERGRVARRAGRQARPKRHHRQERLLVAATIGQAPGRGIAVHGPALPAEPGPRPFCRPCRRAGFGLFQQPVRQHQPGAGFRWRCGPHGVFRAVVILCGVAVVEVLELVAAAPVIST